ncbi:unspecified product [Leishmania tarentolae]|uniref:Unspecified product n=1 Tax=Leishmania tarentolae TaxID=5689 RepID=A0A640KND3_LEITA|nr:unspecified product [Leishmania tarentolae]
MGRRRGAMVDSTVEATVTTVVGKLIANMTNTSANSSTEVSAPPSSLAPEAGRTVDSVILWLVTVFYFSVSAAALGYFVARWRRRVYGADRVLLRGGSGADMGGAVAQTNGDNEGLLAVVSAVIERATSITALAGAASWQQWENSRHRRASPNPGGRHRGGGAAGGGGRSRGWLGGLSTFLPGSQARAAAAKRDKQKSDHGHMDNEVLTAVWMEGPAAVGGTIGGSAVSPSNIGSTMTARDQQQQRGEN